MEAPNIMSSNGTMVYGQDVPKVAKIAWCFEVIISIVILSWCLIRRVQNIQDWKKLPYAQWLILTIYGNSLCFTTIAAVLAQGFGPSDSEEVCEQTIFLCLIFYMSTKVLIVLFLMERAHIIISVEKRRREDLLYIFNLVVFFFPYLAIVILMLVYRIYTVTPKGVCMCVVRMNIIIPLIAVDGVVNLYLTALFIAPLRKLWCYENGNRELARNVLKTIIGSIATLTATTVNKAVIVALKGEAAWICLMSCNADIIFSVMIIHWMTKNDSTGTNQDSRLETSHHRQESPPSSKGSNPEGSVSSFGNQRQPTFYTFDNLNDDKVYPVVNQAGTAVSE